MNVSIADMRAFHGITPGCIIKTDISLYRGKRCIVAPVDAMHVLYILSIEPQDVNEGIDKLVALHPVHGIVWNFVSRADYRARAFRLVTTCG